MRKYFDRLKETYKEESPYRALLLSILITGLAYGLYKGMLDNYLAEVVGLNEMERGITEFFRELPGVLLILVLAAFYMFSTEALYKIGAVIMVIGMGMQAIIPPGAVLTTIAIFVYSFGEHIQLGMKSTLGLSYAKPGRSGQSLGLLSAVNQVGTLVGFLCIIAFFGIFAKNQPYKAFFAVAAVLTAVSMFYSFRIHGKSATDATKRRFYFHKKYFKYYMLEMFYGARKQVFMTFGPYVLILFYGAETATISLLYAITAVACFFLAPMVGRVIDRLGYKMVMVGDTLILVIVCFFYGFAHHIFPMHIAFTICCVNYVLDSIISMASMASNLYVQDLADTRDEVKATVSTGVSINHLISVFIALIGGWVWRTLGIELLFIVSAILGLCNSAYAATIKQGKQGKLEEN